MDSSIWEAHGLKANKTILLRDSLITTILNQVSETEKGMDGWMDGQFTDKSHQFHYTKKFTWLLPVVTCLVPPATALICNI